MSKTKELIICIISIIALVLAITTTVFATESQNLESLLGNTNSSVEEIPEITNNSANNVSNNVSNNITNNVAIWSLLYFLPLGGLISPCFT